MTSLQSALLRRIRHLEASGDIQGALLCAKEFSVESDRNRKILNEHPAVQFAMEELNRESARVPFSAIDAERAIGNFRAAWELVKVEWL